MKALITLLLLICKAVYAQPVPLNGGHRIYIETGINPILLNYTQYYGGGHSGSYVLWHTQIRLGLPINLVYRNPILQIGVTPTFITFGTRQNESQMGSFFMCNDLNAHIGLNYCALFRNEEIFAGPYAEVGNLNMSRNLNDFRPSISAGLQFYAKNRTKISCSLGVFQVTTYEKSNQKLDSYYEKNNFLSMEISHSFPFRLPAPKSAVRQ